MLSATPPPDPLENTRMALADEAPPLRDTVLRLSNRKVTPLLVNS
jgi:hypothetical protein